MKEKLDIEKEFTTEIELADLVELARNLSHQIRAARLSISTMIPALEQIKGKMREIERKTK